MVKKQQIILPAPTQYESSVTYHLYGRDILLLLHVDVCNIQPHVTEVGRCFTHLCENITCLVEMILMCQNTA